MQESPAYINNHEEVHKALEEGIFYQENLSPEEVILDQYGYSTATKFIKRDTSETVLVDSKCILVATGASLNVAYAFEHPHSFERKGMEYQRFEDEDGELVVPDAEIHCKGKHFGPFTSYNDDHGRRVSFVGDTHPVFHGNVVKAIASAKNTYPKIMAHLNKRTSTINCDYSEFSRQISQQFQSTVIHKKQITDQVLEFTVYAPQHIKHYRPGQLYRAQAFESYSSEKPSGNAAAIFASHADKSTHEITFVIRQNTSSKKLLSFIEENTPIALMGPTGVRSKISKHHELVLIITNEDGLAHALSYGQALKEANNKFILLGYFETQEKLFYQEKLEKIADQVIWTVASGKKIKSSRGLSLVGTCTEALMKYATDTETAIPFSLIDRIQIIGDHTLLKDIARLRCNELKALLPKAPKIFGSVHSTMQCMLKGVCAQCLQWQIDPETGERTKAVFACSWQDQPLELIDTDNLGQRVNQNSLQEHIHLLLLENAEVFNELSQ